MEIQKLMDLIEEIQNKNYKKFKGTNEADLMIREEICDLVLPLATHNTEPFKGFYERLLMFVENVQVNDQMSEEEKELINNGLPTHNDWRLT